MAKQKVIESATVLSGQKAEQTIRELLTEIAGMSARIKAIADPYKLLLKSKKALASPPKEMGRKEAEETTRIIKEGAQAARDFDRVLAKEGVAPKRAEQFLIELEQTRMFLLAQVLQLVRKEVALFYVKGENRETGDALIKIIAETRQHQKSHEILGAAETPRMGVRFRSYQEMAEDPSSLLEAMTRIRLVTIIGPLTEEAREHARLAEEYLKSQTILYASFLLQRLYEATGQVEKSRETERELRVRTAADETFRTLEGKGMLWVGPRSEPTPEKDRTEDEDDDEGPRMHLPKTDVTGLGPSDILRNFALLQGVKNGSHMKR